MKDSLKENKMPLDSMELEPSSPLNDSLDQDQTKITLLPNKNAQKNCNALNQKQNEEKIKHLMNSQTALLESASTSVSTSLKISNSLTQLKDKNFFDFYFCSHEESTHYSGDYINEIFETLKQEEQNFFYSPIYGYMKKQREINEQMRSILVDWLIELHFKLKFHSSSLFLTINIIDKFLSLKKIQRSNLQLLGIAAFLIACKQEEFKPPSTYQLVLYTDNAYTREQLIQMESQILSLLDFFLLIPSSLDFFSILAKTFGFTKEQFHFGELFMEAFLVDYESTKYPSSVIACACAYITMKFYKIEDYQRIYDKRLNSFNVEQNVLKKAAQDICNFTEKLMSSSLHSIENKFDTKEYDYVASHL